MDYKKVMETAGFKVSDPEDKNNFMFIKQEDLYFISSRSNSSQEEVAQIFLSYDQIERKGDIINFLDDGKEKGQIQSYQINDDFLLFDYNLEQFSESLGTFMEQLCQVLKNLNVSNSCVHCKKTEKLHLYVNNSKPCILCEDCGIELTKKIDSVTNAKNNYLKGFFASLLGALVASVLWIVLGVIGWYASFAGYVIAFAAFWAYNKVGGKLTKQGVIINICTIIFALIFAEYVELVIQLAREIPGGTLFGYILLVPSLLFYPDVLKHELISIAIGALFSFLGCNQIIKSNLEAAKNMNNINVKKID